MTDSYLQIRREYLKTLIRLQSNKLVGKLLKRFEICDDISFVKKEAKELIYESYRDFQDLLDAHDKGLDIAIFDFKKGKVHSTPKG